MSFMDQFLSTPANHPEEVFRKNMDGVLEAVRAGSIEGNERLRGLFGVHYSIDEMALLFATEMAATTFITALVERDGFELFNSATDTVQTAPIRSSYEVRYWFLSTPWEFRLELMVLGQRGFSPVHEPFYRLASHCHGEHGVCAVHASFKVPDEEKYAAVVHQFQKYDYVALQHCQSSYGRFSYFSLGGTLDAASNDMWHLKPRINTRDAR